MSDIKLTIVFRKDLKIHKGKIGSSVGHAVQYTLLNLMRKISGVDRDGNETTTLSTEYTKESDLGQWLEDGSSTKIVLGCDTEDELMELYETAEKLDLPVVLVIDNGVTEFNGVKTKTCIAIGPASKGRIDVVTGHLKPL